jgi:hypothetical protein
MPDKVVLSPEELAKAIEAFKATATNQRAREAFAESRADVILPLLQEQSTIRNIFDPEFIGYDEAIYNIPHDDIEMTWLMPQIGGTPVVQLEGTEMRVSTFLVHGGVEWQQRIAAAGRINQAEQATTQLLNRFVRQEERAGWALIKTHAAVLPTEQKVTAFKDDGTAGGSGAGRLNIYTISETLTVADSIGIGGRRVTDIYVSPRRFGDLRNAVTMEALPPTMREKLWGNGTNPESPAGELRIHKVYNPELVTDAKAYAFTQKDGYRYGVMPIREKLVTRDRLASQDEWKNGVEGKEEIGFGVLDDKGLIEITF